MAVPLGAYVFFLSGLTLNRRAEIKQMSLKKKTIVVWENCKVLHNAVSA
jgi:hypothetical protein